MPKKPITIIGGLIALYLVVANWKGFVAIVNAGAKGGTNVIGTLQGRNVQ